MRIEEIRKWINEGGSLPQDLTQKEKDHLTKLGWSEWESWFDNGQKEYEWNYLHGKHQGKQEAWHMNGQKWYEANYLHEMKHGVIKKWNRDGDLLVDQEYFYGNRVK